MSANRRKITVIAVIAAIVLGVIFFQNSIKQQLLDWDLLPKPEPITELYFTRPSTLPTTYTPAQPTTINFTLHNDTQSDQTYRYVLSAQPESTAATTQISTATVNVSQGQTRNITVSYTPNDLGPRVKFNIQLLGTDQNINFWATKS